MATYKTIFFSLLLLSVPFLEARKSGGGSASRGSSGARTSSAGGGGFSSNRGGGSQGGFSPNHGGGQSGGFGNQRPNYGNNQPNYGNQRPNYGNQPHYNYPQGFQQNGFNRSPGFNQGGSGLGSASRGSTFKHALAGAAIGTIGGLLVFEAGKAIINSATTPFHHGNRDYYFDQQNYRGPQGVPRCSMPLQTLINTNTPVSSENGTSADQTLQNLQFKDGTKPKEVVWSCNVGEICCGSDCCPAPQSNNQYSNGGSSGSSAGWIILLVILALLVSCCLGCFCVYKFCRSSIESCLPSSNNPNNQGYYDDGTPKTNQEQSYPMNQYNNQPQQYPSYPQQNYPPPQNYGYPPNPGPRY